MKMSNKDRHAVKQTDHIIACKLFVWDKNTWNHITMHKQMIIKWGLLLKLI